MLVGIEYCIGDRLLRVHRDDAHTEGEPPTLPIVGRARMLGAPWGLPPGHPLTIKWPGRHVTLPEGWTVPHEKVLSFRYAARYDPVPVKIAAVAFITIGTSGTEYRTNLHAGEFIQAAYIELGIARRLYVVVVPPPQGLTHTATEWPRIVRKI